MSHWHYGYDKPGRQVSQTDPNNRTTTFGYDVHGNRTSRTLPLGQAESWTYDARGRVKTHTDFKGQLAYSVYTDDPALSPAPSAAEQRLGRLAEERRYPTATAYANTPGSPQEKTVYQPDTLGRPWKVTEYTNSDMATPTRLTTTLYDPVTGNVSSVASPGGTSA